MKRALIVGINYPGTSHALRGCVNDARTMEALLRDHFDFTNIKLLLDNDATTVAMKSELEALVAGAEPGDTLFFHYSGHGSQMIDKNGEEADGLDEIICPVDLNWKDKIIYDDELKVIFDKVQKGVDLVVSLDCCNSGGGLDQDNQYQPLTDKQLEELEVAGSRFLPPPAFAIEGAEKLRNEFKPKMIQSRDVNTTGLLFTGCQSQQTSADAYIGGKYQGAFTYALAKTIAAHDYRVTHIKLIDDINQFMVAAGFTQRPELNGSPTLFEAEIFRTSITTGVDAPDEELLEPISVQPIVELEKPKEDSNVNTLIIAGIITAAAVIIYMMQ